VFEGLCGFLGLRPWQPERFDKHNARPRSDMDDHLRRSLAKGYEEDDERLAAWLGRAPSWRR
jgi:hypothetical protein